MSLSKERPFSAASTSLRQSSRSVAGNSAARLNASETSDIGPKCHGLGRKANAEVSVLACELGRFAAARSTFVSAQRQADHPGAIDRCGRVGDAFAADPQIRRDLG